MGAHEDQLRSIARGYHREPVSMPALPQLNRSLEELSAKLKTIVDSGAWKGSAAEAAAQRASKTSAAIDRFAAKSRRIADIVDDANRSISHAASVVDGLPSNFVDEVVDNVVDVFGDGAEDRSEKALRELQARLADNASELRHQVGIPVPFPDPHKKNDKNWEPDIPPVPDPTEVGGGDGGGVPSYGGSGSGRVDPSQSIGSWSPSGGGLTPPHNISVDGSGGGTTGGLHGGGTGTLHPGGGSGGGSGLVPGLGGAAGVLGMGAAARAAGMGGGGGSIGSAGMAGARLGGGALSGSAGSSLGGSGAAAGSSASGAAAGGRGGTSMMGGGGAGGAAKEEKRSGLGGLIAPKLEDDEEVGPRSAAAGAGGRQATSTVGDDA